MVDTARLLHIGWWAYHVRGVTDVCLLPAHMQIPAQLAPSDTFWPDRMLEV